MTEEKLPKTDLESEREPKVSGSRPLKRARKKRYVKYSPLSLVLLGICSFVFCFSILGLFEQSIFDYAGRVSAGGSSGGGMVFLPAPGGSEDDLIPLPSGTYAAWQKIAPDRIDTDTLPFLHPVAFDILKKQNRQTVAWMYWPTTTDVKGLPFNMAVVQTTDNDYYLTHSFDNSYNANGWIYADYRCDMKDIRSNRNTILYAHARSYLMFGGLRFLNTKTKWQQDGYNHFIYINTPTERTVWQIFSWYETTTEFNYIKTDFSTGSQYVEFLNTLQSKNTVPAFEKFDFVAGDRILTLSTCKGVNSDARVAVHAVLVKYEKLSKVDPFPDTDNITTDSTGTITDSTGNASSDTVTDLPSTDVTTDSVTDSATDSATDTTVPSDGTVTDSSSSTDAGTTDSSSVTDTPDTDSSSETDQPATDEPSSDSSSDIPSTDSTDSANSSDTTDSTDSTGSTDSVDSSDDTDVDSSATEDLPSDTVTDTESSDNVSSDAGEDLSAEPQS